MQIEDVETITQIIARVFPRWESPRVERVQQGGSTRVYRVRSGGVVNYVRIRPEAGASLIPEATVHEILRSQGVRVPDVLYVARVDPDLGRSIMVTTEVAGCPVGYDNPPMNLREILRSAGRDLASINVLPVDGFGWVANDLNRQGMIQGEFPTYADWIDHDFGNCTNILDEAGVLIEAEVQAIGDVMRVEAGNAATVQAYLAHGDFDVTHIYHAGGAYSGIIDFGEIRGAPALYDLAHFQIENSDVLPDLLEGYEQVKALPPGYHRTINFLSLLIALGRLTRHVQTGRNLLPPDVEAVRRWGVPSP